jgi:probable F420-dependent oxidoreductase
MRFAISTAFLPVSDLVPLAEAADEFGYDSLAIPDHVVDIETLTTPYPYTEDGSRRWDLDAEWPDPWVLIGSLAARTQRLRFFTSVYVPALRNPYLVAKAVGTAAVLSGNRVALGVGIGWCTEEFELLEQDFRTRGARTDEGLDLIGRLLSPGWTEFDGKHYEAPRLVMNPTPTERVPVFVGGLSDVALARAARHDGWVGDRYRVDEAIRQAQRVQAARDAVGAEGPFDVMVGLNDAITPADFARAEAGGVNVAMTWPWAYYYGPQCSLAEKVDALERFATDVIEPVNGAR